MKQLVISNLGKEYNQGVYCHLAYLTHSRAHHVNAWLDESQDVIKIARRNINSLRYADDTTGRNQRGTKKLLDESEKGK